MTDWKTVLAAVLLAYAGILLGALVTIAAYVLAEWRTTIRWRRIQTAKLNQVHQELTQALTLSARRRPSNGDIAEMLNNLPMAERVNAPDEAEHRTMTPGDNPE